MIVAIGSKNPTKTQAVKNIFKKYFQNIKIIGVEVRSGVKEQPQNINEAFYGALTRAQEAIRNVKNASYGVGIEGGIHKYQHGWMEQSVVVITDSKGKIGVGSSGALLLPRKVVEKIKKGYTLEQAVDNLFGTSKIGRGIGAFGLFTKGVITRTSGMEHGVAFALSIFLHEKLYE